MGDDIGPQGLAQIRIIDETFLENLTQRARADYSTNYSKCDDLALSDSD